VVLMSLRKTKGPQQVFQLAKKMMTARVVTLAWPVVN
jgi:hypothetical protein